MIRVTALYPASAGRFDYDYYLNKHAPLVLELWKPHGLLKAELSKGLTGMMPGSAPDFITIAVLTFESAESLQNALAASGAQVMADLANFTDVQPLIQVNEILM